MWRARVLEAGVAIGAVVSLVLLVTLLAAPLMPQPATGVAASPVPTPTASPRADVPLTPIGIYQLRGAFSFGPCLALELGPEAYPVADGAEGTATVHYWLRGMTGCDARTGEVLTTDARVTRALNDAGELVGYGLRFMLPLLGSGLPGDEVQTVVAEIVILARQSSEQVLQAIEAEGGQGMVLDRVPGLDPRLDPLPSTTPVPTASTG